MAYLNCNFKSEVLGRDVAFTAVIPDQCRENIKCVYVLHGLSDDSTCWSRLTSIERYARDRGVALIMPTSDRGFYCDMKYGPRYYTHVAHEIVDVSRKLFRLSTKREDTFIMGQSMGGYGTFKIALRNPETFGGAVSFSGAVDINHILDIDWFASERFCIWGENPSLNGTDDDLFHLADKVNESPVKPRMLQICGTEDFLYEGNIKFKKHMETKNFDYKYIESKGDHTWEFWDYYIPTALDFLLGN